MSEWCDLLDDHMLFGPRAPGITGLPHTTVLSRAAFDRAVHDVLRDWHQRERLAGNPLLHAAFVARPSGDPEENLRRLVLRAIESIDQDPRAKGQRAAVWGRTSRAAAPSRRWHGNSRCPSAPTGAISNVVWNACAGTCGSRR